MKKERTEKINFLFPAGFRWGSASSAFQVEGGCPHHDFYDWALKGRIKDGTSPIDAVRFWEYYKGDIALMKRMGHNAARIGIEWARIEPSESEFDEKALAHYRSILREMQRSGISPMLTLHHFANPMWLVRRGGWENPETADRYLRFVQKAAKALGDLVDIWITINEPSVYAVSAYLFGEFPPGKKSFRRCLKVMDVMIDAHVRAYSAIHEIHAGKNWARARVGIAKHLRTFDPLRNGNPLDRLSARLMDKYFNNRYLERISAKGRTLDLFGINYYSGDLVKFPMNLLTRPELSKNKLGWDIYPEGLYRVLRRYWDLYRLPIYITENGTCEDGDEIRPRYILDHLYQLHRAFKEGVEVAGYYHWSTLDNFELVDGLMSRFGLVHVDHGHPKRKRTLKRSGLMYGEIARAGGITGRIVGKYAPDWRP
ncbi:MAG TPA: glycoside hydrolase family 1 protein [Spirochaetota bacterium]|nr:glycoside hydrolase family 1 protein [Spirochaetota bacterium]